VKVEILENEEAVKQWLVPRNFCPPLYRGERGMLVFSKLQLLLAGLLQKHPDGLARKNA
jgi:hypothetical protein